MLSGEKPGVIQETVADIEAIIPQHIVPAHYTGFEVISIFYQRDAKAVYRETVGTKYVITAGEQDLLKEERQAVAQNEPPGWQHRTRTGLPRCGSTLNLCNHRGEVNGCPSSLPSPS